MSRNNPDIIFDVYDKLNAVMKNLVKNANYTKEEG